MKDLRTGRVRAREPRLVVTDAIFKVSLSGHARAQAMGRKTQHAGVRGAVRVEDGVLDVSNMEEIRYDPSVAPTFRRVRDGLPMAAAREVVLTVEDGRARMFAAGLRPTVDERRKES